MSALPGYPCLQEGLTALHVAAQEGHLECLQDLLARGADVDWANNVSAANSFALLLCATKERRRSGKLSVYFFKG